MCLNIAQNKQIYLEITQSRSREFVDTEITSGDELFLELNDNDCRSNIVHCIASKNMVVDNIDP